MNVLRGTYRILSSAPLYRQRAFCDQRIVEQRAEKFCIPRAEVEKRDKWQMAAMASKAPGVDGIMAGGSPMVEQREQLHLPASLVCRFLVFIIAIGLNSFAL